jgi:hypothetical protein
VCGPGALSLRCCRFAQPPPPPPAPPAGTGATEPTPVTCTLLAGSILLHLADHAAATAPTAADGGDGAAVVPLATLAAAVGVSSVAAQRAATALVEAGVVTAAAAADGSLGLALARCDTAGDEAGGGSGSGSGAGAALLVGGASGGAGGVSDDPPEAVALWRSYLEGMLTNLGPQSLDALHGNLTRFTAFSDFPCECAAACNATLIRPPPLSYSLCARS